MEICDALKRFRKEQSVSQRQLAERIGVPYQSYQTYESGSSVPSAKVIIKISKAFSVSTDYLLGLRDTPNPNEVGFDEVQKARELRIALRKFMDDNNL